MFVRRYCGSVPDEDYTPENLEILRRMTPEKKLEASFKLYWTARELKAAGLSAGLRMLHPDWTEDQVQEEVRRIFFHARS